MPALFEYSLKWTWCQGSLALFLLSFFCLWLPLNVYATGSGSATTTGSVTVPVATLVSCSSSEVTVLPGNRTSTLEVTCVLSGNPNNLTGNANSFTYPANLISGSHTLVVTPLTVVTSPDGSITAITGSYSSFNGTLQTGTNNTWRVQSTSTVDTTTTTPAGTYTGTVTYNWSTI